MWKSGDGLDSALTDDADRRVWVDFGAMVTIPAASCSSDNQYLGVELLTGAGQADAWTENDYVSVRLLDLHCSTSGIP